MQRAVLRSIGRLLLLTVFPASPSTAFAIDPFTTITVAEDQAPWGKDFGDVNGDGVLDILEGGGNLNGAVLWREYPSWSAHTISSTGGGDDLQTGDVNGDGAVDVVVNGNRIAWYENPRGQGGDPTGPWAVRVIEPDHGSHDLTLVDVTLDGKLDVVARGEFGPTNLYVQLSPTSWTQVPLPNATNGIGSAVADIDRDGRPDIVENGYWLKQPLSPLSGTWSRFEIGPWSAGSSVAAGDVNGDGRLDVTLAASESGLGALAWFEAPSNPATMPWTRHDIGAVEDVHRHHLVDVDQDGDLDVVFAEMHQSAARRVGIYYNAGAGAGWTLQTLSANGSHNIAVGDLEGDGDMDIVGANWNFASPDAGALMLWRDDRIWSSTPGLLAAYFDNADFTNEKRSGVDGTVDFNWGAGSPDPAIGPDTFSARWTGRLTPLYSETYSMTLDADDGVRLWIDNQLIIDHWVSPFSGTTSGSIALTGGVSHSIRIEHFENSGNAHIRLLWSSASQPLQVVPSTRLMPDFVATGIGDSLRVPAAPRATLSVGGPNPFHVGTNVEFSITQTGPLTVRVFDLQGRRVATLFDGVALGGRAYRSPFNASRLPAGVYFAQLRYAGIERTRKLILLR